MQSKGLIKRSIISALALFVGLGVVLAIVLWVIFFSSETSYEPKTYKPEFQKSDFELVTGDEFKSAHLYFKTATPLKTGDSIASIDLASVAIKSQQGLAVYQSNKEFAVKHFQYVIDEIHAGYVVMKLPRKNFDCFAIYRDHLLVKYDRKDFSVLPTPSDAWMCAGFDFHSLFVFSVEPVLLPLKIALTNESHEKNPIKVKMVLDDNILLQDLVLSYYLNPIEGTPEKNFSYLVSKGRHELHVIIDHEKFDLPITIGEKGLYIDLRYCDLDNLGQSEKKQYPDGRILIREGRFQVIMAPPGVIGYD